MKIHVNPDPEKVKEIRARIRDNNGYCPCRLTKSPETKCICKDFLDQEEEGYCHCGLYYKVVDEDDD